MPRHQGINSDMLWFMRTTLTLDDDVVAMLEKARRSQDKSFKAVVNEALRMGLAALDSPAQSRPPYRMRPVSAGRCLVNNLDDIAGALAVAEGEGYR